MSQNKEIKRLNREEHYESFLLKSQWSMSTMKIFLDNTNEDKASEAFNHKEYLEQLVNDLLNDRKMMLEDFGKDDKTVKKYFIAIKEIRAWIHERFN